MGFPRVVGRAMNTGTESFTTTLRRVLDAAGPGLEVSVKGTRVSVALVQQVFDVEGNARGLCLVEVEGVRGFGGIVTFENPPKVTVVNALPGEEAEMARTGRFMVEALTEPPTAPRSAEA